MIDLTNRTGGDVMSIDRGIERTRMALEPHRWARRVRAVGRTYRLASPRGLPPEFDGVRVRYTASRWTRLFHALMLVVVGGILVVALVAPGPELGGRLLFVGFAVYGLWFFTNQCVDAAISTDGDLWFRGWWRVWRCHVEDVSRVGVLSGDCGAYSFRVRTTVGAVLLPYANGQPMVDAILAANPAVISKEYPPTPRRPGWWRRAKDER